MLTWLAAWILVTFIVVTLGFVAPRLAFVAIWLAVWLPALVLGLLIFPAVMLASRLRRA